MGGATHLLIASIPGDHSAALLAEAGRTRGLKVEELSYHDVSDQPLDPQWTCPGTRAILRDPYRKSANHERSLRRLLEALPVERVLDGHTLRDRPDYEDKLFQFRLLRKEVPVLASWPATRPYDGPFPVVLKRRIASGGRGTFLVRSADALDARLRIEAPESCLLQEYRDVDGDYRVLVLGGEVIGVVSRVIRVHEEDEGTRLAVKVDSAATLPAGMLSDAKRAAALLDCDFSGVDILTSVGRHVVLECNISPQFRSTEVALERDVASDVVDFLLSKTNA